MSVVLTAPMSVVLTARDLNVGRFEAGLGQGRTWRGQGRHGRCAQNRRGNGDASRGIGAAVGPRMQTMALPRSVPDAPLHVLRFAASFLWADHRIETSERRFFLDLARELGLEADAPAVTGLLQRPPLPEDIDPNGVPTELAGLVRKVALRAIASDGEVAPAEMEMFFLLDELLPNEDRETQRRSVA